MDKKDLQLNIQKYLPLAAGLLIMLGILLVISLVISPMVKYSRANGFLDREMYKEAIELFEELGGYEDSETLLARAKLLYAYSQGEDITAGANDQVIADDDLENSYLRAKSYIANKKYDKAAAILRQLGGYKDSRELLEPYRYFGLEPGEELSFGSYEQDRDLSNGREAIKWTVVSVEENRMLLIADAILDCSVYAETGSADWSNSKIREFLNGEFYDRAFTATEKAVISKEKTQTAQNPEYGTKIGADVSDYVIIPDIDQMRALAGKAPEKKRAEPSPYAVYNGVHEYVKTLNDGTVQKGGWFWLRNTGFTDSHAAVCYSDGDTSLGGQRADVALGIRPAIYIDLNTNGD